MDRETLFRGKRIDNGEWQEGYYIRELPPPTAFVVEGEEIKQPTHWIMYQGFSDWGMNRPRYMTDVSLATVGQFTGLLDKNKKRIFEGDIFKDGFGLIAVVEWDDDNARFIGITIATWDIETKKYANGEKRIVYVGRAPSVEVIGNIHDNPELLKQTH